MITLDDIKSNNKNTCLMCGVEITKENDSGWELFVDGKTTQPICKNCDMQKEYLLYINYSPLFEDDCHHTYFITLKAETKDDAINQAKLLTIGSIQGGEWVTGKYDHSNSCELLLIEKHRKLPLKQWYKDEEKRKLENITKYEPKTIEKAKRYVDDDEAKYLIYIDSIGGEVIYNLNAETLEDAIDEVEIRIVIVPNGAYWSKEKDGCNKLLLIEQYTRLPFDNWWEERLTWFEEKHPNYSFAEINNLLF